MLKRLAWLALCVCAPLSAAPHIDNQRLQQLANDPFWISLGHYETAKLGGWRSYVSDKKFFLAADGNEHPDRELAATVQALYAPASAGEQHAQCVYPARTRWLKAQLKLSDLPTPDCAEFKQWFKDVSPHSAVMIFPAAYLNSPSSMFGHTLLRIDQANVQSDKTSLLSYAINFGAYIEGSDNSILYAWKGLMGGYPGLFALVPYQEKLSEYRSLENRDLWEYRLNLTQAGNRAHGRARLGAEADPVRLFLLRRKLLLSPAGTAASGPPEPAADRAIPADRDSHRHRQSGERSRAGGIDRVSPVPRA